MSHSRRNTIIIVATVSILAAVIYSHRSYLKRTWTYLFANAQIKDQLEHISLIEKALLFVNKSLAELKSLMTDMPNSDQLLNLKKLTSEIDYIFEEIDSISGDDYVKSLRRELVNSAHLLSEHLDKLLKRCS